jgi:YgiT-type zinc finger domain-containing protein
VLLNHVFGAGANMIVVENVLTMVCDNCGQSYFTGDTLEKLDEILAAPQDYAALTVINVADLSSDKSYACAKNHQNKKSSREESFAQKGARARSEDENCRPDSPAQGDAEEFQTAHLAQDSSQERRQSRRVARDHSIGDGLG